MIVYIHIGGWLGRQLRHSTIIVDKPILEEEEEDEDEDEEDVKSELCICVHVHVTMYVHVFNER